MMYGCFAVATDEEVSLIAQSFGMTGLTLIEVLRQFHSQESNPARAGPTLQSRAQFVEKLFPKTNPKQKLFSRGTTLEFWGNKV